MSQYNIEPHFHEVDSIIIVTSTYKSKRGKYLLHDNRLGFETIIEIPLCFGNVIGFPRYVNHTFKPSDTGLSTLNTTDSLIQPQTEGFSYTSTCNFDEAMVMSYSDFLESQSSRVHSKLVGGVKVCDRSASAYGRTRDNRVVRKKPIGNCSITADP